MIQSQLSKSYNSLKINNFMRIAPLLFALVFAQQVFAQRGENLKITTATANAAKDNFAVYRNNIVQSLMESRDTSQAIMFPQYFELSKDLITALSAQLAEEGAGNVLHARLGIVMNPTTNKPMVTLIFETKNSNTQSSTYFDFTRPCPPACTD